MNISTLSGLNPEEHQSDTLAGLELPIDDAIEKTPKEQQPKNSISYLKSLDINLPSSSKLYFDEEDEDFQINRNYAETSRYSMITDEQTTENFMKQFDGFYKEMIGKVRSLKTVPALKGQNLGKISNTNEENLFKNLKDTPEVEKKLKAIRELDDEIKDMISLYNVEKSERLQTQLEMCNEIHNNNTLPERDTQMFLEMCNFEFSEEGDEDHEEVEESRKTKSQLNGNFIRRNAELANKGFFANCSLTDEEKIKLENILSEEDKDEGNANERYEYSQDEDENLSNAYTFTNESKNRMNDLDSELEKFLIDERGNEKSSTSDNFERLSDCLLKLNLEKIESKLNELRSKDSEEQTMIRLSSDATLENNEDCPSDEAPELLSTSCP